MHSCYIIMLPRMVYCSNITILCYSTYSLPPPPPHPPPYVLTFKHQHMSTYVPIYLPSRMTIQFCRLFRMNRRFQDKDKQSDVSKHHDFFLQDANLTCTIESASPFTLYWMKGSERIGGPLFYQCVNFFLEFLPVIWIQGEITYVLEHTLANLTLLTE